MTPERRARLTLPRFRGYRRPLTATARLAALTVQAATIARLQADAAGHCRALAERDGRIAFLEARVSELTNAIRPKAP